MNNTKQLLDFINKSKTAFQGAHEVKNILDKNGFTEIKESDCCTFFRMSYDK